MSCFYALSVAPRAERWLTAYMLCAYAVVLHRTAAAAAALWPLVAVSHQMRVRELP